MARAFSEDEKIKIKEMIAQEGKKKICKFGFKKTSIDDIVNGLPISKGSFYSFFQSKEELYIEIIKNEELIFKENLLKQDFLNDDKPQVVIKGLLKFAVNEVNTNPIWQNFVNDRETVSILNSKMTDENKKYKFDYSWDVVLDQFKKWTDKGLLIDKKPEIMAHIIRSLFLLSYFKPEFGDDCFDEVMDFLIDVISNALVKK